MIRSALLLTVGLTSCGGGAICPRYQRVFGDCTEQTADEKAAAIDACKVDIEELCTPDDVVMYDAYLDCWRKSDLGCPADMTSTDELEAVADCDAELDGRSDACVAGGP